MSAFGGYSGQAFSPAGDKGRFVLPPAFRKAVKDSSGSRVLCLAAHDRFACLVGFGLSRTENVYITNSGVAWEPAIKFSQDFLGADRVLYAMDYPYQHAVDEVIALDGMTMSAENKKRFFQTNAETVFKIPPR